MRKTFLVTMILLVVTAWAVAQQGSNRPVAPGADNRPSAPSTDNSQASQPSAAGISVEGCLGGSAENFTVTDRTGTTYQLQLPQNADTSKLSQHIGEEVRVTGTITGGNDSGAASPGDRAGSSAGAGSAAGSSMQNSINVTKMDKIGDTCGKPSSSNPK
jgi:hypothetical protein